MNRRDALRAGFGAAVGGAMLGCTSTASTMAAGNSMPVQRYKALDEAANRPVLRRELVTQPVMIDKVELLRRDDEFMVRVTFF